jgi:hypothetical protein
MFIAKIAKAPHTSAQWLDATHSKFIDAELNTQITNTLPETFRYDVIKRCYNIQKENDPSQITRHNEKLHIDAIIMEKQNEVLMINKLKNSTSARAADHSLYEIGNRIQAHEHEYLSFLESELSTLNIYNQIFDFSFFGLFSKCSCNHSNMYTIVNFNNTDNHLAITMTALKFCVASIVTLMYFFCFFQLVLSSVSIDTCIRSNAPPPGLTITKMQSSTLLKCGEIVAFCSTTYLDHSTINLSAYLAMRIFFYLFSLVPLLFLTIASQFRAAAIVSRLIHPSSGTQHITVDSSYNYKHSKIVEPKVSFLNHDNIWLIAAILFIFSHMLGSVLTLAADVEIVKFFSAGMSGCPQTLTMMVDPSKNATACVCSALYYPSRGVFRMPDNSGFQIKQVYDVAATLLFFNLVYTIWGFLFVLGFFWKRHMNHLSILKYTALTTTPQWTTQVAACNAALHQNHAHNSHTHGPPKA